MTIGLTYCFADYNIMLGVYLPAPGIQIVVELGQVEKMADFELVGDALTFMVLNLPEERS